MAGAVCCAFFFSSRRRHTRYWRDWSSDVCSSDLRDVVELKDVFNGVFKSFIFSLIIGTVSCHQGLITRGGPRGIGRSVTKAVVNSIVLIVIVDYILTRVLLK